MFASTTDISHSSSPYITGSSWWFSVKAVDRSGNRSVLSNETFVGMAVDATPPQAPSTPVVADKVGLLSIYWDGLPATGSWAADFDHVNVYTSAVNNFTPTAANRVDTLYGKGTSIVANAVYDAPLYVKLTAVDRSGNESVPSAQGSGIPDRLVNTDLITGIVDARLLGADAVTSAAIADLAVGTAHMIDLSVVNAKIGNLAVNDAKITSLNVGKLAAGTMAVDMLVGGRIMTAPSGNRVEMTGTGIRMWRGTDLSGHWNPSMGQLRIYNTGDASHTSTGHGIQFGDDNGQNLIIDNNEIMGRLNGSYGDLFLNREGGPVGIGGRPEGYVAGQGFPVPKTPNHRLKLTTAVWIQNTNLSRYDDEYPPLTVGDVGGAHLWMDSSRIGAAAFDSPAQLNIQPRRLDLTTGEVVFHQLETFFASEMFAMRRLGAHNAALYAWEAGDAAFDCGLQFFNDALYVRNRGISAYRAIGASAFNVVSEGAAKQQVTDLIDPLAVVRNAPSKRYQYRPEVEDLDRWHHGPMLEDLPEEMRQTVGEHQGVNIASEIGVLWGATGVLDGLVSQLVERVAALEGDRGEKP
jgi:hypothetical protein